VCDFESWDVVCVRFVGYCSWFAIAMSHWLVLLAKVVPAVHSFDFSLHQPVAHAESALRSSRLLGRNV
jgi:hypothetical protein